MVSSGNIIINNDFLSNNENVRIFYIGDCYWFQNYWGTPKSLNVPENLVNVIRFLHIPKILYGYYPFNIDFDLWPAYLPNKS